MPKRDATHMNAQRERILRATIECIARKGVEGMSLGDIRKQSGFSTGAIYTHFANKEDIVAEALRYGVIDMLDLPGDWHSLKRMICGLENQLDFDIETIARLRLHLRAECTRPGKLHDIYRPILEDAVDMIAQHLARQQDSGEIRLALPARQTALAINAFVDGTLWMALSIDRPFGDLKSELSDGLDRFVTTN